MNPTSKVEALREQFHDIREKYGIYTSDDEWDKAEAEFLQAFTTFLEGLELPDGIYDRCNGQCRAALHQVVTALRGGE